MIRWTATILAASVLLGAHGGSPVSSILHSTRSSPNDLEISGQWAALDTGSVRYVSYTDLLTLPQVSYTVSDDTNFPEPTQISGVPLEQLASALGASPDSNLIVAICADKYRANYPREYLEQHHPVLVLKVNGKPPAEWPRSHSGGSLGPYLVSHAKFTPSFRVLSHDDEPQIPFSVTRLEFRNQSEVFGAIKPPGEHAPDSPVAMGYRIAKQNCFRCHNMGAEGGQMAARPWLVLSAWASSDPAHFTSYVHNPRDVNPASQMPPNPQYDRETIEALRAYFATFAAGSH